MKKFIVIFIAVFMITAPCFASGQKELTTMASIEKDGEMTFAMTGAYPPFNFINEEGEFDGFDIDIANALADELGVIAVPITTAWDGIIGGLLSSRFDSIIGSMAITDLRLEKVNFTKPYYYDGAQFFAPKSTTLTDISDLDEGTVGVVTGTTFHNALKEMENVDKIMQFESDVDNIMALEQGRVDGLVTGRFVGLQAPKKYGVDIIPVGEMLYAEKIGIATRKGDADFLNALNAALDAIVENGTYEEISQKWFNTNILKNN